ncbi:hypothetical protein [Microbacterium sp. NPDC058389]|uniref:hypothetical protein n=1 Tax=Microbacterium sp. NPDC058389 TaxID=3346475 RepID=UPI00365FE1BE
MAGIATRARVTVAAVVAGVMLAIGASGAAWADPMDDLITVDGSLSAAVDAFATVYSDQTASNEDAAAAAETFQTAAESAQTDFQSIADEATDAELAGYAEDFAGEAGDMAAAAGDIAGALGAEDVDALSQAETDLSAAMDAYSASADAYNAYLATVPVSPLADPAFVGWLIVLAVAVVFLILALVFALVTRKHQGLLPAKPDKKGAMQQTSLQRLRWMVVLWAGVFVVGAAIPFFQVAFAQPDANGEYTYNVFWYPLAAGVVLSIVGLVQYFVAAATVRREGSAPLYDPNDPFPLAAGAPAVATAPATSAEGATAVPVPVAAPAAPVEAAPAVPVPVPVGVASPAVQPEPTGGASEPQPATVAESQD